MDDRVALGCELLEHLEHEEVTMKEAIDLIEDVVTTDRITIRRILDRAELEGVIERHDGILRPTSRAYVRFQKDVITKEGEFSCRRCGKSLSTGYFIRFDAGELGPFGSTCIRKVTGRE